MGVTGSQIAKELEAAKDSDWQRILLQHALQGDTPSWALEPSIWPWVVVKRTIGGRERTLAYQASPNYFAVGTDEDPLFAPLIPAYAQQLADRIGAIMVSRQMVSDIERGPSNVVRLRYEALPLPNHTPASWVISNRRIWMRTPQELRGTVINGGSKKNVVIGPSLDGSHVAIFGAFNGVPTKDGWVKPPYVVSPDGAMPWTQGYNSTFHDAGYFDHSHGIRWARRAAFLDGAAADLRDVFRDPSTAALVSDQGAFDPRFPNISPGLRKTATFGLSSDDDQGYAPIRDAEIVSEEPTRSFPWAPVGVGVVAFGILFATLRMDGSR